MGDIHELKTRPLAVQEDVVARLTEALEMAKRGEIAAVAIAMVHPDGGAGHMWSGGDHFASTLGAIARLQYVFNQNQDGCDQCR